MEALLNLEAVASHNVKSLSALCDQVESHVRSLKSLGVPSSAFGILLSVLVTKLPHDVRLLVSRRVTDRQ